MAAVAEYQRLRAVLTPGGWPERYVRGEKIGEGNFGIVYQGTCKATGEKVAIKTIRTQCYLKPEERAMALHEVQVLAHVATLRNPNLLNHLSSHEDVNPSTGLPNLTIVTKLYTGGELFDRIVSLPEGHYTEESASKLTAKLAKALMACHTIGIVHRDLKPENILLESAAPDAEPIIADFGLSLDGGERDNRPGIVGTYMYCAPEIIRERVYGPQSDVFALGVLVYIFLVGYQPFYADSATFGRHTDNEIFRQILAGEYDIATGGWEVISPQAKDLVQRMLALDPRERITMEGVLAHPWIREHDTLPRVPLTRTQTEMRRFNLRRRVRAAAAAVRFQSKLISVRNSIAKVLEGAKTEFTSDELSALSVAFKTAAAGRLSVDLPAFKAALEAVGLSGLPAERLFALCDEDGSGGIDYREFCAGLTTLRRAAHVSTPTASAGGAAASPSASAAMAPPDLESLRLCFRLFDVDGSGGLSREEVIRMLAVTGFTGFGGGAKAGAESPAVRPPMPAGVPDAPPSEEAATQAALEAVFSRLDLDGDGIVTLAEFESALASDDELRTAVLHPLKRFDSGRALGAPAAAGGGAAPAAPSE